MSRITEIKSNLPFLLLLLSFLVGCEPKTDSLRNTVYHVTFTLQGVSDNSRNNSGFILKLNDTLPPLYLTAHHVASGYGKSRYYDWDKIRDRFRDGLIWSIHDNGLHFQLGKNLPIPNAKVSSLATGLDLAAFYLAPPELASYLKPASSPAKVGDRVRLFAKLMQIDTVLHPGIVIYATDSLLVYQLFSQPNSLGGSSGSPVLNDRDEVVANSFGGLPLSSVKQRQEVAKEYPFIRQFLDNTEMGKTYGIGVPVGLIRKSLIHAIRMNQKEPVP